MVVSHVRERVRAGMPLHELMASVEVMLREQKIVLPGVTVLERLIGRARVEAEDELFRKISERVDDRARARILALLKVREGEKITPFQQLQQAASRPSPNAYTIGIGISLSFGILALIVMFDPKERIDIGLWLCVVGVIGGIGIRAQLPIRPLESQGLVEVDGLVEFPAWKAGVSTFVRHLSKFLRREKRSRAANVFA